MASNAEIMQAVWLAGTTPYQQATPPVNQGDISAQVAFLNDPNNRQWFNQFQDNLLNRVGNVIIHSNIWEDPLGDVYTRNMPYGSTIEEVGYELVEARVYNPNMVSDLLEAHPPKTASAFHSVNYEQRLAVTVNENELHKAFLSPEDGLDRFLRGCFNAPVTTNNILKYEAAKELIAEFESKWGFFHVETANLNSFASTKDDATATLRKIRAYGDKLRFAKRDYNAYGLPVWSTPETMRLFVTPEVKSALDVDALAQLFNLEPARVPSRITVLDEFPIDGAQALYCDENWFVCGIYDYSTESFYDPAVRRQNQYLFDKSIISCSPMQNAILLTTDTASTLTTVTVNVTGAKLDYKTVDGVKPEFAPLGAKTPLEVTINGTVSPADKGVIVPQGAYYEITASDKALNPYTYVDKYGVLHVSKNEKATNATVKVTASYINPDALVSGQAEVTATLIVGLGKKYTPPTGS